MNWGKGKPKRDYDWQSICIGDFSPVIAEGMEPLNQLSGEARRYTAK